MIIRGKVHHMPTDKRFFFIRTEENRDYFCHADSLLFGVRINQITVGDLVEFVPVESDKGARAEAVVVKRLQPETKDLLDELFGK